MPRASSKDVIVLSERRRWRLEAMVARPSTPQRLAVRARIVLAAWRGQSNAAIAASVGVSVQMVRTWRRRFCRQGLPGLHDRPRSGRPPVYGLDAHLLIVASVTAQAPQADSHWTHRALAAYLAEPVGSPPPRSGGSWPG